MASPDTFAAPPLAQTAIPHIAFDNTYARLPERFYARARPTTVAAPRLIQLNTSLARQLGLDPDALTPEQAAEIFAGNRIPQGADPMALAYAGHQFGYFVPQLGDGRAILLGEAVGTDGKRYDIQLKGSGRTPFSRNGDGRAVLGPVLREYLVSEAMAALGVPTARALAAVTTGESVMREGMLPGAVFTRVAASHLRVGTFQFFAARKDVEGLRMLADYAIQRHYPEAAEAASPYRALLEGVIARQASLVAQWLHLGFIHGVMNTDNCAISGETIDYGPCAFMEAYDPDMVFSSIDRQGRYAYANQPQILLWNLMRLAETLLPLIEAHEGTAEAAMTSVQDALGAFAPQFQAAHLAGLRRKLGFSTEDDVDAALAQDLLDRMTANQADFTLTFRRLCDAAAGTEGDAAIRVLFADPTAYDSWAALWRDRLKQESVSPAERAARMRAVNPAFIPRNHLVQEVITAAVDRQDFAPFHQLLEVVTRPYDDRSGLEHYTAPALPEERITQTFCGT